MPLTDLKSFQNQSLADLRKSNPALAEEITKLTSPKSGRRGARSALRTDVPISSHPAVAQALEKQRFTEMAKLANLEKTSAEVAVNAALSSTLDDDAIDRLVKARQLTNEQAQRLGAVASLTELAHGDPALAAKFDAAAVPRLGRTPHTVRELATLSATDWQNGLRTAQLPAGMTLEATAGALADRFSTLFPGIALASRLPPATSDKAELTTTYRGLGLEQVDAATATRRVASVHAVLNGLDTMSLLEVSLASDELDREALGLDKLGVTSEDEPHVLAMLKTYQRAVAVGETIDRAYSLVRAGFTSALSISNISFAQFAKRSGMTTTSARKAYDKARAMVAASTLSTSALFDAGHGMFEQLGVYNVRPAVQNYLKQLPGYEGLFGNLSLCACEECQSMLGAAAYFVDLMKFVDDNIRDQLAGKSNHPLDLRTRRPDLWELPLTCSNTNDRVPTLDLVNEILENHIARDRGYQGALSNRVAIRAVVYPALATMVDSFGQPFDYPLARVTSYLAALGNGRSSVADVVGLAPTDRARVALGLLTKEWNLLLAPDATQAEVQHVYGVTFATTLDTTVLMAATRLDRTQLGEILATSFVKTVAPSVKIVASKQSQQSVQNDVERATGLTLQALDRVHRLTRLQRRTPWTFAQLDDVLSVLAPNGLTAQALVALSKVRDLQSRLGIRIDEALGLVSNLPTGESTEFDRRFNPASYVSADGSLPAPARHFVDPALRTGSAAPSDPALPRLLAGLGLDLSRFSTLVRHLAAPLGLVIDAPVDDDRFFALSLANLTLLYRHALLARKLGTSIDDLFQLLGFLGRDHVETLADVETLVELHAWWRSTRYKLDEIALALGQPPRDATILEVPAQLATELVEAAKETIEFQDTLFAVAPGVPEQASREIVLANPTVFEAVADGVWTLATDIDPATVVFEIPASAQVRDTAAPGGFRPATQDELRSTITSHLPAEIFVRSLATALHVDTAKLRALLALTGQSATTAAITEALRGGAIDPLVELIRATRVLSVVFAAAAWTAEALDAVRLQPALYGPGTFAGPITLAQVRGLSVYARLAQRTVMIDGAATSVDPLKLRDALAAFDGLAFAASSDAMVAAALGVPIAMIVGLRGRLVLDGPAASALDQLDRAAQLAIALGIDAETLAGMVETDFATLDRAAEGLLAALRSRNTDEAIRAQVVDDAEKPVREARRDALVDHMLHSITPRPWKTAEELYRWFLIDIDAGGCSTTSRVVAAISSVQLYVHRVRMNLEQDTVGANNPAHVSLEFSEDAAEEWTWRQNYRVWQANRKVFLWPENYLEPDLRDDKTPEFETLESELLQQDIDDQNVLDAYTKYVTAFEEVSSLVIAGAYHERKSSTDVLHLIGVAQSDPMIFYYRSCRDLIASGKDPTRAAVWSPWQKISVQITGRRVAPVVHNGRLHVFWTTLKTRPVNKLVNSKSEFSGYSHRYSMFFTTLRADGTWTSPQSVELPADYFLFPARGEVEDPIDNKVPKLDVQRREHEEAIEDYTLTGPSWEGLWPTSQDDGLYVRFRDFLEICEIDLFSRVAKSNGPGWPSNPPQLLCAKEGGSKRPLCFGRPSLFTWESNGLANLVIEEARLKRLDLDVDDAVREWFTIGLYKEQIASIPERASLLAIPGSVEDAVLQVGHDVLIVQGSTRPDDHYQMRRIGTTLARTVARTLFEEGVDVLLDTDTQEALAEHDLPIDLVGNRIENGVNSGKLDFTGPYGVYYRELFFHIPFLIANALNAQGRFAAAQQWYHRVFDPTSTEKIIVPTSLTPAEREHRRLDRVWRYREFRNLDVTTLRDILTDKTTIALYKDDPFNPFAIARSRLSAFQKAIVMKYLDNLLDWADDLFTQFTMESVNEALMLYITAQDILGPRPRVLGDCGVTGSRTYASISPLLDEDSEMLIEAETRHVSPAKSGKMTRRTSKYTAGSRMTSRAATSYPFATARLAEDRVGSRAATRVTVSGTTAVEETLEDGGAMEGLDRVASRTASWAPARGTSMKGASKQGTRWQVQKARPTFSTAGRHAWALLRQFKPVFCVPPNSDLIAFWDRVEDRLFKLRNCMDITGTPRELSLFAPPIDPRLLIAARAAGLSLQDVLAASRGGMPPYRFAHLIDRAKAVASSLSGFGAVLLSSLEKRDNEELNRIRLVQQKNIATMTRQLRQLDIDAADAALEAVRTQLESAEYRYQFYKDMIATGRSGWEVAQSVGQHVASGVYFGAGITNTLAAAFHLMPQIGSPFAMKYGGSEMGTSARSFAMAAGAAAVAGEALAKSAALEAGFDRREEGWINQRELANFDRNALKRQVKAAEIRLDQANRSLTLHEKSQEHLDEQLDVLDGKFTNLGRYTWLTRKLQTMYRAAYQNAVAIARLAEQAFRFERNDTTVGLDATYWDPANGGLLAGEQLLASLQTMERRYLETNVRSLEVDQAFSMGQIDPRALIALRETGQCTFAIPEVHYDLFYPGQYKRRIKAVRLTIPCITGPYVNVGATLSLSRSWMRTSSAADAQLVEVPPSRSTSIATSTAQADSGVFEMSFRDERYMPFEGAGAISEWQLTLPRAFKQFDYETITDVILTISYTAEHNGMLRDRVESQNATIVGGILEHFTNNNAQRLFSMRQDFSSAFTRVLRSPLGTAVGFELSDRHLPVLFRGRDLEITQATLLVRTADNKAPTGLQIAVDGTPLGGFAPSAAFGGLFAAPLPGGFGVNLRGAHQLALVAAPDDVGVEGLLDVSIHVAYHLV